MNLDIEKIKRQERALYEGMMASVFNPFRKKPTRGAFGCSFANRMLKDHAKGWTHPILETWHNKPSKS